MESENRQVDVKKFFYIISLVHYLCSIESKRVGMYPLILVATTSLTTRAREKKL